MYYWKIYIIIMLKCIICKSRAKHAGAYTIFPQGNDNKLRTRKGFQCSIEEYPYLVRILGREKTSWKKVCGGSLLSSIWVLTAAHCMTSKYNGYAVITADKRIQTVGVGNIYQHPSFDAADYSNDISLLRLAKPVKKSSNINFVQLPEIRRTNQENLEILPCAIGIIVGWSKVTERDELKCAEVPLLSIEECRIYYRQNPGIDLSTDHLCTRYTKGVEPCIGGDGGMLLCGSIQVGIRWGLYCKRSKKPPGVFTNTDKYLDFIAATITGNSGEPAYYGSLSLYLTIVGLWYIM